MPWSLRRPRDGEAQAERADVFTQRGEARVVLDGLPEAPQLRHTGLPLTGQTECFDLLGDVPDPSAGRGPPDGWNADDVSPGIVFLFPVMPPRSSPSCRKTPRPGPPGVRSISTMWLSVPFVTSWRRRRIAP